MTYRTTTQQNFLCYYFCHFHPCLSVVLPWVSQQALRAPLWVYQLGLRPFQLDLKVFMALYSWLQGPLARSEALQPRQRLSQLDLRLTQLDLKPSQPDLRPS